MDAIRQYKRQTREVPQHVRDKISASLTGKKKTPEHRANISKGLRADTGGYWSHIPKKSEEDYLTDINDLV